MPSKHAAGGESGDGRSTRRRFLAGAAVLGAGALAVGGRDVVSGFQAQSETAETVFDVRVENVSTDTTLGTTAEDEAAEQAVPLSPGAYAVHTSGEPIFTHGEPERDNGLEEVAEDGDPDRLVDSLADEELATDSGAVTTPVDADDPAPIGPGEAYEFSVTAGATANYLSFVTMFVPSNDLFYALGGADGFRLFDENDEPVEGDVTDEVGLWDAGTEINEEPGVGENQVQRQRGDGVGLVERDTVVPIEEVNGYDYPTVDDVVEVTITPRESTPTATETATATETETATATEDETATETATATATGTETPNGTATETPTATDTATETPNGTATEIPDGTATETPNGTPTPTNSETDSF